MPSALRYHSQNSMRVTPDSQQGSQQYESNHSGQMSAHQMIPGGSQQQEAAVMALTPR